MTSFKAAPSHAELKAEVKRLVASPDLPKNVKYSEKHPDEIRIDGGTYFLNIESAYGLERIIERITPRPRRPRKA